jgi:hypothetical protein
MLTRSQSNQNKQIKFKILNGTTTPFEVNIDFDDASACWRQNKKALSNGMYKYVCPQLKKDGTKCGIVCYKVGQFCWQHRKSESKSEII